MFEVLQDADIAVESGMMETVGGLFSLESIAQTEAFAPTNSGKPIWNRPSGGGVGGYHDLIGHLPRGLLAA